MEKCKIIKLKIKTTIHKLLIILIYIIIKLKKSFMDYDLYIIILMPDWTKIDYLMVY